MRKEFERGYLFLPTERQATSVYLGERNSPNSNRDWSTVHLLRSLFCLLLITVCIASTACAESNKPLAVPTWAADAIWYQIFVERFRNGDANNDPTPRDTEGAWPHLRPNGWEVTPWGHDWYEQEEWARQSGRPFYSTVQMRRYGGDLQGVLDKLDYLKTLGVTAIYLNPINDSPSLHKYDARNYRHVDANFGPDPQGDRKIMSAEDPVDPKTWQWTAADRLFLKLIRESHRRNIRVIVDYSWNHTGATFWAWQDILIKQADSPYAEWYDIQSFDNPSTPENEFSYRGWAGVKELPEFRKFPPSNEPKGQPRVGDLHPVAKTHMFAVASRWLDPNADGNCSDGVDGFRLDVAERVPIGFWRSFAEHVIETNPEAILIAELWWEKWPDLMLDPAPWIQAGAFHSSMNYRWYAPSRRFVTSRQPVVSAKDHFVEMKAIEQGIPIENVQAMMNVAATHDTPRVGTSLLNRQTKYKFHASARRNAEYRITRPPDETLAQQKLLLVQQFTWIGAPHIYYGDEVGMWGADDPDCRKPMIWPDITHAEEQRNPDGSARRPDRVEVNQELLSFYKKVIAIRRQHAPVLARGKTEFIDLGNHSGLLAFKRSYDDQEIIIILNRSNSHASATIKVTDNSPLKDVLANNEQFHPQNERLTVSISALRARVFVSKTD